jgi:hypothetical protein
MIDDGGSKEILVFFSLPTLSSLPLYLFILFFVLGRGVIYDGKLEMSNVQHMVWPRGGCMWCGVVWCTSLRGRRIDCNS